MPKYKAKSPLLHNGNAIQVGGEVELTTEQAKNLGDKVGVIVEKETETVEREVSVGGETFTTTEEAETLGSKNVNELKEIAKEHDIEGYTSMKKDELIKAIEARQ